ncbi:MAG TPA: acireductone synthase [Thermoanaerobaculia bacterium]
MTSNPRANRAVLTDIEGTTTSISFVYDTLFPYAAKRLDAALSPERVAASPEIAAALSQIRAEHATEIENGASAVPEFGDGVPYARYLMAADRKSTGLKALQGLIWQEGYAGGELRGHVFPDVPDCLTAWRRDGVRLRVFSSGSVQAQKLLFGHSEYGDLTPLFEGFHDTTTGPKQQPASYTAIAEAYGLVPERILFLSDVVAELDAAAAAGMRTGLLVRPGNKPAPPSEHRVYTRFDEIAP